MIDKLNVISKTLITKYPEFFSVFFLIFWGFIIYSNSLNGSFHLDDISYIKENGIIRDFERFFQLDSWKNINHRPLPTFTFALNYKLNGFSTKAYHVVNLIIHLMTVLVAYGISKQIIKLGIHPQLKDKREIIVVSFIISLLFLTHPIQTQTVNYIVQRMTLLAALFYLLSVYSYLRARVLSISRNYSRAILYYIFTAVSFILALLSKQIAVTIPFAFLLIELLLIRKSDGEIAKKYTIVYTSGLVISILIVVFGGFIPRENDLISREVYFSTQLEVIFRYIYTLFMPISLNFDPYIELSKGIIGLKELIYLLLHVGILVFGVLQYKKRKYLTFGIFWFYLVLSVESSFIPIRDVMFDHRVYLPSLGFFTILVLFFYPFLRKRKKVATFMIILLVLSYSFKSFKRNEVWENDLVFWQDVVSKPPVKARSYSFLGIEYMFAGKYSKALRAFNKSIEKDPGRWQEHNNKAVIYIALKQYEKALKEYDMCIKKDDSNPDHYINRAEIYLALGKLERFNKDLEIAESLGNVSDNAIYYALKGKYYLQIGKNNEAISNLDIAISIDPKDVDAINNRGIAKMRIQKYEESIIDFSTVIRIDHTFLHAFQNRGEAWFLSGNFNNSLADFNHVITKDKASGRSYKLRGLTYLKLRNYPLAYEDLKIAQKYGENLDPKMMQDLSNYLSGDI